jgi:hypothetical protein
VAQRVESLKIVSIHKPNEVLHSKCH